MITGSQSVVEDSLQEVSAILSLVEIQDRPSFAEPIKLAEMWQALPGDIPHYKHIRPALFDAKILPFIYILDVVTEGHPEYRGDGVDFKFRLFGTGSRDNYGKEGTSRFLSDMSHAGSGNGFTVTQLAYETKSPQFLYSDYIRGDKVIKSASYVILPLSDDTGNISRMFGCGIWHDS